MATNLKLRVVAKYTKIQDCFALKGTEIGQIGTGMIIEVDMNRVKEGWVPILGPEGFGPSWLKTSKEGWIELAHTNAVSNNTHQYITIVDATTGEVISCNLVS